MVPPGLSSACVEEAIVQLERQNEMMVKHYQQYLSMNAAVSSIAGLAADRQKSLLEENRKLKGLLASVSQKKSKAQPPLRRTDDPSGRDQTNEDVVCGQEKQIVPQGSSSSFGANWYDVQQNIGPMPISCVGSSSHTSLDSASLNAVQPAIGEQTETSSIWEACN